MVVTHEFPLEGAPEGYRIFNDKQGGCIKASQALGQASLWVVLTSLRTKYMQVVLHTNAYSQEYITEKVGKLDLKEQQPQQQQQQQRGSKEQHGHPSEEHMTWPE